jgi:uncharacterized membrane protein YedE/YeeE
LASGRSWERLHERARSLRDLSRLAAFDRRDVDIPTASGIDRRLLAGAALFGIGWGLAGFCPGPALAALVTGELPVVVFVCSMVAATAVFRWGGALRGRC